MSTLVLTRRFGEAILVRTKQGEIIRFRLVQKYSSNQFRISVEAPRDVEIHREEVWVRKMAAKEVVDESA